MAVYYAYAVLLFTISWLLVVLLLVGLGLLWIFRQALGLWQWASGLIFTLKDLLSRTGEAMTPTKLLVLLIVLGDLLLVVYYQSATITKLRNENAILVSQIEVIKKDSQAQTNRVKDARKNAIINTKRSQIETKQIMLANVSPKCHDAIKWGIEKAHDFN